MSAYLVIVLLLLPSSTPGADPLAAEMHREVAGFSSTEACERHAERVAQQKRAEYAELLRRTGGRTLGTCRLLGGNT